MRTHFFARLVMMFVLLFGYVHSGFAEEPAGADEYLVEYNIGIVTDGPLIGRPDLVSLFQQELVRMAEGAFLVNFPKNMILQADSTSKGVNLHIDRLLNNPEVDLILTLGTIGSTEALKRTNLPKPVVAPFVFDAELQKAPMKETGSGIDNLFYVNLNTPIDQELIDFRKLVPFKTLGLLLDERDVNGVSAFKEVASYLANEHSIKVHLIPVRTTAQDVLAQLQDDTHAVMVGPLWQLPADQLTVLSNGFIERKIAAFSIGNHNYVKEGFFASTMPEKALEQLARQVAINVQEILLGENPSTLPVAFSKSQNLVINMATARAVGVYPSLDYMTGANLINEERLDIERRLTLPEAVAEALAANLDLEVAQHEVTAGSYSVEEAKSNLLPQLSVGAGGMIIDEDRAAVSNGIAPERTFTGALSASMEIYSERSWAGYTVEKHIQGGREYDRDRVRLNIIFEASTAYLDVLRQETITRLQKDNMQLTQANLDRAQIRLSTGIAGPDELYRWQTKFANDRQTVLRAESSMRDARQRLNRILHRPLTEEFIAQEADLSDPLLISGDRMFYQLIHNPLYFKKFNAYALEVGQDSSPELKFLDAAISAQKRLTLEAKRDYWVPVVTVEGDYNYLFSDDGEGTRDELLTGLDDSEWQVAVFARLPLYEGGRKGASLGRNREQVVQLQTERRATAERVDQRILQALNNTRASYPSINLSRDAVDAARRNLQLVTDSYVEGIKSVIDLLDAQNQALSSELDSANAVYDFLIDLMGVQRSIGVFTAFLPTEERQQWIESVQQYLQE